MNKAAFLDRDGVIIGKAPEGGYITCWDQVRFLPGAWEAIKRLTDAGFAVIVVTNQRGIAKRLMTEADLEEIHTRMKEQLAQAGVFLTAVYYCPHEIFDQCRCRKPEPGMLLKAAQEFDIDCTKSWMVGDALSDIEAGEKVGARTVLISDSGISHRAGHSAPDFIVHDLAQAVDKILNIQ